MADSVFFHRIFELLVSKFCFLFEIKLPFASIKNIISALAIRFACAIIWLDWRCFVLQTSNQTIRLYNKIWLQAKKLTLNKAFGRRYRELKLNSDTEFRALHSVRVLCVFIFVKTTRSLSAKSKSKYHRYYRLTCNNYLFIIKFVFVYRDTRNW